MTEEEMLTMAQNYRNFREECGIKDPTMLNEIETAYYLGLKKQMK